MLNIFNHHVQGSPKECFPGFENFLTAVAYHFWLNLPRAFSQPGKHSFGDPCTRTCSSLWLPRERQTKEIGEGGMLAKCFVKGGNMTQLLRSCPRWHCEWHNYSTFKCQTNMVTTKYYISFVKCIIRWKLIRNAIMSPRNMFCRCLKCEQNDSHILVARR